MFQSKYYNEWSASKFPALPKLVDHWLCENENGSNEEALPDSHTEFNFFYDHLVQQSKTKKSKSSSSKKAKKSSLIQPDITQPEVPANSEIPLSATPTAKPVITSTGEATEVIFVDYDSKNVSSSRIRTIRRV